MLITRGYIELFGRKGSCCGCRAKNKDKTCGLNFRTGLKRGLMFQAESCPKPRKWNDLYNAKRILLNEEELGIIINKGKVQVRINFKGSKK